MLMLEVEPEFSARASNAFNYRAIFQPLKVLFETGSHFVTLAGLELYRPKLVSSSQKSICISSAQIKGLCYHAQS